MMEVMKDGTVIVYKAEWIPGEDIAAVIADSLNRREGAKNHALTRRKLSNLAR